MKTLTVLKIESKMEYIKKHAERLTPGNVSHHRNVILDQVWDILKMIRLSGANKK